MPRGIQLQRRRGWRQPANTVVVSRPSRWGNPFHARVYGVQGACERLERWMYEMDAAQRTAYLGPLQGKDLACWCPVGAPCHRDILLRWANDPLLAGFSM
jgi:hypothetical protein